MNQPDTEFGGLIPEAVGYITIKCGEASYEVTSMLKVVPIDSGLSGFQFLEEEVARPYLKGPDSSDDSPSSWPPFKEFGGVECYGYAACPDVARETMFLWYQDL